MCLNSFSSLLVPSAPLSHSENVTNAKIKVRKSAKSACARSVKRSMYVCLLSVPFNLLKEVFQTPCIYVSKNFLKINKIYPFIQKLTYIFRLRFDIMFCLYATQYTVDISTDWND